MVNQEGDQKRFWSPIKASTAAVAVEWVMYGEASRAAVASRKGLDGDQVRAGVAHEHVLAHALMEIVEVDLAHLGGGVTALAELVVELTPALGLGEPPQGDGAELAMVGQPHGLGRAHEAPVGALAAVRAPHAAPWPKGRSGRR